MRDLLPRHIAILRAAERGDLYQDTHFIMNNGENAHLLALDLLDDGLIDRPSQSDPHYRLTPAGEQALARAEQESQR